MQLPSNVSVHRFENLEEWGSAKAPTVPTVKHGMPVGKCNCYDEYLIAVVKARP